MAYHFVDFARQVVLQELLGDGAAFVQNVDGAELPGLVVLRINTGDGVRIGSLNLPNGNSSSSNLLPNELS